MGQEVHNGIGHVEKKKNQGKESHLATKIHTSETRGTLEKRGNRSVKARAPHSVQEVFCEMRKGRNVMGKKDNIFKTWEEIGPEEGTRAS